MRADLRLWWPTLALWASSAAALAARPSAPAAVVGSAAAAAVVLALLRRRPGEEPDGPPARRWVIAPAAALTLLAALTGVANAGLRVAALVSPALPDPGTSVAYEAVVDSDPRVVEGSASGVARGPDRVVIAVTVTALRWHGGALTGRLPATLWAPVGSAGLLPGALVGGRGVTLPGSPTSGVALGIGAREPPAERAAPPPLQVIAGGLRSGLRDAVRGLPADGAALLPGLVLGDESTMGDDLADALRGSGLAHLTAVSGMNVSIVLVAALGIATAVGVRGRWRALVATVALAGFVVLVRPSPSVVRAAAMGAVVVVALLAGGRRRGPPALAAAVLGLLLVDPWLSVSVGFALSAAATAGLLLLAPRLRDALTSRFPRTPRPLAEALAITGAAQLCTAPLLLLVSATVGLGAVPANLLAEPLVAPATLLGLAATLASPVSPALAHALAVPAVWCASWIALVARGVSGWAPLTIPWPTGAPGAALAALALLAGWAVVRHRRRLARALARPPARASLAGCVAVGVTLPLALPRAGTPWPPEGWRVVFCDVGQGDAAVLRAAQGTAVVVDAGPRPDAVDRCLRDLGVSRVTALVLTHFHADHVEGVPGVLRGRSVDRVLVSPLAEPADGAARVARWAGAAGIAVEVVTAGDVREAGEVRWQVIWPRRVIRGQGSDPNNASVTALASVGAVRVLLGGDLEPAAQAAAMAGAPEPGVLVLKVPHHGSRYQHPRFAPWSGAVAAVVSVGTDNDYGHPAPETLAALAASGVAVWRTDVSGDVAVVEAEGGVLVVGRVR